MARTDTVIGDRYKTIVARAAEAALRSGRRPEDVTVLAAAKTFGVDALRPLIEAGAHDVGENYVQEAASKASRLPADLRWHLIGRLQRNKARAAVKLFDRIHSLDRVDLARSLDAAGMEAGHAVRCLVEVNLGGEPTKGGVVPASLERFLQDVASLEHLSIEGLMTVPPPAPATESRHAFARLRELGERCGGLRLPNVQLKELSMGMSGDFEEAIEEGATIVRIGTAIFGPRG